LLSSGMTALPHKRVGKCSKEAVKKKTVWPLLKDALL